MTYISSIGDIQAERIEYVKDQVGVSTELARALLIKNRWEVIPAVNALLNDGIQQVFNFSIEEGEKIKKEQEDEA